jgi:hypothetical protein
LLLYPIQPESLKIEGKIGFVEEGYMQKLSIVIAGMLVVSGLFTLPLQAQTQKSTLAQGQVTSSYTDELDQKQETMTNNTMIPIGRIPLPGFLNNIQVAQSFVPTKAVLTRVQVGIAKNNSTTTPFSVSIRQELNGDDLTQVDIPADQIPNATLTWVDCDFPDYWVLPGNTYYIVCKTENVSDNWYVWAASNDSTSYPNGCAWVSLDGSNWNSTSAAQPDIQAITHNQHPAPAGDGTWDTCFRTYGLPEATLTYKFTGTKLTITNDGNVSAQDLYWNINYTGGLILIGKRNVNGTLDALDPTPGSDSYVVRNFMLGFGKIDIKIQAGAANAKSINKTMSATLILFFFLGIT